MKSLFNWLSLITLILFVSSCHQKSEKLLLAGSGWEKIVIIDKTTKQIEWEYPLEKGWECNSAAWTPDGNILFSYSKGARLISLDGQTLWDIPALEGEEMQTAKVLDNGNYLLAACGHPARILEVTPKGKIERTTTYETGIEHPHAQFRQINKSAQGNYLIPLFQTAEVREINPEGKLIRSVKMPGNSFCVIPQKNGNYLTACGDAHCYAEFNLEEGKIIRTVESETIEGIVFCFVAQLLPSTNGGLFICNWQGHDPSVATKKIPQLIEIDKEGKVVWTINDNQNFGMISTVDIITDPLKTLKQAQE